MTEKRPSWKDILWTPVYDFVDKRWGIWGLRLFAISIALFPAALLFLLGGSRIESRCRGATISW